MMNVFCTDFHRIFCNLRCQHFSREVRNTRNNKTKPKRKTTKQNRIHSHTQSSNVPARCRDQDLYVHDRGLNLTCVTEETHKYNSTELWRRGGPSLSRTCDRQAVASSHQWRVLPRQQMLVWGRFHWSRQWLDLTTSHHATRQSVCLSHCLCPSLFSSPLPPPLTIPLILRSVKEISSCCTELP